MYEIIKGYFIRDLATLLITIFGETRFLGDMYEYGVLILAGTNEE